MIFFTSLKRTLFLVLFSSIFAFSMSASAEIETEIEIEVSANKKQDLQKLITNLKAFTIIYNRIEKLYVDEIDIETLFVNAIKGMANGLDPHSDYLKPKEQKQMQESASGKFGGLGIVIGKKDDAIQVISPIDDTPAYRAGIQAGDLIIKINEKPVRGMTLEDGVDLMRGKPGTDINITISRKNKEPFVVKITREIITIVTVKGYLLDDGIGYIRISSFQQPTINLLKKTLKRLSKENDADLKSLILDLRNNPGGILSGAVSVSDLFLDDAGLVVYTKGRIPSSNTEFKSNAGDILNGVPMVVLMNKGSASASEIVAGALQDHKRAIIMGETSFGKGSVQTILGLEKGYGLKITTARYYTPNGRSIQAKGIVPDIKLENISLGKEKQENVAYSKEGDLKGHLEAETETDTETKNPTQSSDEEILDTQEKNKEEETKKTLKKLKEDYFVHEASNLLKALNILGKPLTREDQ
ncbi:Carboxyl-terminal protease [uncultured Candidatus Thioglobus sp.]|nr:Carboxyl-terminal protease [uncultured Candidatus Thioglobus sp.]